MPPASLFTHCSTRNPSPAHFKKSHGVLLRLKSSDVGYVEDTSSTTWEDGADGGSYDDASEVVEEDNDDDELLVEYKAWSKALKKAHKGIDRKRNALQSEMKKAEDVEKTMARAQLIVSNLYQFTSPSLKSVIVQDWENDGQKVELALDPQYDSASAEADALFDRVRKLKRGSQVVGELLLETDEALQLLEDARKDLDSCISDDGLDQGVFHLIQERLRRSSKKTKFASPSVEATKPSAPNRNSKKQQQRSILETSVRKLLSPGGCIVWVGRNKRGNEYLSFNVARGDDIWMHARGSPGAHVILQNRRGSPEPTEECLEFCANLAAFYSDARTENKASITAAEPKHIQKPRGAPLGAVKLREELFVRTGYPDRVPEDLKLARDESGQGDDFRRQDKAKHRRRTNDTAKQNQAKRRAEKKAKKRKRRQSSDAEAFDPY